MVLHSSLSSFVASTRLIWSGVGAIDSPDQSRQGFEQYDTSEVLEKIRTIRANCWMGPLVYGDSFVQNILLDRWKYGGG